MTNFLGYVWEILGIIEKTGTNMLFPWLIIAAVLQNHAISYDLMLLISWALAVAFIMFNSILP